MTVGVPISLSFQSSNVPDPTQTLEEALADCVAPIFEKPREVRSDEWVYEYRNDTPFTPKTWNQADSDAGVYDLNEIVYVSCLETDAIMGQYAGQLIKVKGKRGDGITEHRRPKEPEEYSGWDEGIDFENYQHRYMRVSNHADNGWLSRMWFNATKTRWYYMFWEARGYGGCGDGAWRWSVKDTTHVVPRTIIVYQRTCQAKNYSNSFNAGKDVKALVYDWGSPSRPKEKIIQFQSMIERNGYFYFRTHLNVPIEYTTYLAGTATEYMWSVVTSPADIDGFVQSRRTNATKPFDGKAYTKSVIDTSTTGGKATWILLNTSDFNSIAIGGVICDSIDFKVMDVETGETKFELNNYEVDNTIGGEIDINYAVTRILYTKEVIDTESVIEITLYGASVEVGEILGNMSLDAGFTKPNFKNNFKDFTPREQDQWGNWLYLENGLKVHVHSGTVEFPIVRYDEMNRLMLKIGGGRVVVNSSDSTLNEQPDGHKVFDATMMIARFTNFELDSKQKDKRIGEIAQYNFKLEELV